MIEVQKPQSLRKAEDAAIEKVENKSVGAVDSGCADEPVATPHVEDKSDEFTPEKLVGAWKLVSGEARGVEMAKDSTGGIYVFTKDTLTGKSRFGEEKSWMNYTLDTKQNPVAVKLTITKNFVVAMADAIVDIRDGKLHLCYGGIGKGPTSFTTKAGENNRSMVFVRSVDPAETQKEVAATSEKNWNAIRDQQLQGVMNLSIQNKFAWTTTAGKRISLTENFFDFTSAYNNAANKVDEVNIFEQNIIVYSESAVETGRATAIKKDIEAPIWDIPIHDHLGPRRREVVHFERAPEYREVEPRSRKTAYCPEELSVISPLVPMRSPAMLQFPRHIRRGQSVRRFSQRVD